MFNSVQKAKRKVITFDDDGEAVPRPEVSSKHTASAQHRPAQLNGTTTQHTDNGSEKHASPSFSSSSTLPTTETSTPAAVTGESTLQLTKKQKRKLQFQGEARPKKLANREPTTDAIL